jgi:hypothetical protein
MKNPVFLIALLLLGITAHGQEAAPMPGNWSMGAGYHYGFIVAHQPAMIHLQQKHVHGFELNWQKLPKDTVGWNNTYGFPWLGITYMNLDLGNPIELGKGHALLPSVYFPLTRKHPLSFMLRFSWGIGYIQRPFNSEDNYKNLAIGSRLNSSVNTALLFRVPATSRLQVSGAISFTHFSNGATSLPNLGLNIPTIQAGLHYIAGNPVSRTRHPDPPKRGGVDYSISLVAGVKDIYPPEGKRYVPMNLSLNALKDVTVKSMVGFGTDIGIDKSMEPRLEEQDREGFKSTFRLGLHGTYGLHVGKVHGLFQVGSYLYNPLTLDGDIYSRLAFRCYVSKKLFLSFNLKTHFAKADYFEGGLGYSIRK